MTPIAKTWEVRLLGTEVLLPVPTAQAVLDGLRNGDWDPSDEVRAPASREFAAIEDHPTFLEAVAEMGPPPSEKPDETRLDMNPLIDVALVLLIFFILTTSYASLKRAIDLPPAPPDPDAGTRREVVKKEDIQDRTFRIKVTMDGTNPVVKLEDRVVLLDDIDREVKDHVRITGRKELFLSVADEVPWGIEARIYDAAKGAEIRQIYWPSKR
jgi:biopolymer transport protein ExbD